MGRKKRGAYERFEIDGHRCPYCKKQLKYEVRLIADYLHVPYWVCKEHGPLTRERLDRGEKWIITSATMGEALVISRIELFDTDREVFGCGLPVFTEACIESMKAMAPDEARRFWQRRRAAIDDERALRKADPGRTVHGPGRREIAPCEPDTEARA